ncbi:MAG: DUF933 domain-containing protein [Candidatus Pacebacteria bacterium]|nr:DUF933 domain-containing protein [Candidatus Paceibacterota bacterium]
MFSVGIIGLPNVGKSTLFKALTKIAVPVGDYPFTTIDPNHGIVAMKDKKLEIIKRAIRPEKITPPMIEFIDIAGLVKGAHKGEGLGNQFLSNINEADILLEVIKNFSIVGEKDFPKKKEPQYQLSDSPDPERDIKIIKNEILKRDERILYDFLKEKKEREEEKDIEVAEKIIEIIKKGGWIFNEIEKYSKEEGLKIEEFAKRKNIISSKPIIYLFNGKTKKNNELIKKFKPYLFLDLKTEEELLDLKEEEKEELGIKSNLDDIVLTCYNDLDLITFYTIKGDKEARAIELKKNSSIIEAAEKVHSDFKEKFISAEVLKFEDFENYSSWQKAKEKGLLKTKGKDYIVENGDIIEFKI